MNNNYYRFSICHTSWINSAKNYFISDNKLKSHWFFEFQALLDAKRWIYLYNHLQSSQSARAKNTITCVVQYVLRIIIIIRCIFSFHFIGRELTTWPANTCLQISVLLQIIFCPCVIETTLLCENSGSVPRAGREWFDIVDQNNGDRMMKQLLNSVIAKYCDLSGSCGSIIIIVCLSRWLRQIFDLLATDKSRYFAQCCSIIIVNYLYKITTQYLLFSWSVSCHKLSVL